MSDTADSRLLVLVAIGFVGVGVVFVGASLGIHSPVTDTDPGVTLTVSTSNVTLDDGDRSVVLMANIETAKTVEITHSDGRITVRSDDPLTDRDRTRALDIAQENTTVQIYLDRIDGYELEVEPVVRVDSTSVPMRNVDVEPVDTNRTNSSGEVHRFEAENTTVREQRDSVTIHRNRSYVDNRAVVRIRDRTTEEVRYAVRVDLVDGTVVDITEREPTR